MDTWVNKETLPFDWKSVIKDLNGEEDPELWIKSIDVTLDYYISGTDSQSNTLQLISCCQFLKVKSIWIVWIIFNTQKCKLSIPWAYQPNLIHTVIEEVIEDANIGKALKLEFILI